MNLKKTFFLFSFLLFNTLYSQTFMNKDSLLSLIKTKKDTSLVQLYIDIGQQYEGNIIDSSKYYYFKARDLSRKLNYVRGELNFIANYTFILNNEGNFKQSLFLNKKAIALAKRLKDDKYIGKAYANTGASYQLMGKYEEAINYMIASSKIFKKLNINQYQANLYLNIGVIYNELGQNDKYLYYSKKAEAIFRELNMVNELCMALNNKGIAYIFLDRLKEAEAPLNEALIKSKQINNQNLYATSLLNICDLKIKSRKFNEIKPYAEEALKIGQEINFLETKILALKGLGIYYLHQKDYDKAQFYALNSFNEAQKYENKSRLYETLILLSEIAFSKQNPSKGSYLKFKADSISNVIKLDETRNKIEGLKLKYETEKKELKIKTLTQENDIQNLKIKRRFWIMLTLGLILLSLAYFAFLQFKNFKTKKELLIEQQKTAVAEERLRIASDMHDDVGTGLSRIRYIINSIKEGNTPPQEGLNKVTEISDVSIGKMSEILWALNENNQNLEELIYHIRSNSYEMVENAHINFIGELPETIPNISFGWMRNRNTYLLVKETINNAIKHSNAKNIYLKFEIDIKLKIIISDDGKGFDSSKKHPGNGLNNYAKRIEKLGGNYNIKSTIGKGTTVEYNIPL